MSEPLFKKGDHVLLHSGAPGQDRFPMGAHNRGRIIKVTISITYHMKLDDGTDTVVTPEEIIGKIAEGV